MTASHTFLAVYRSGLAALLGMTPNDEGRGQVEVRLQFELVPEATPPGAPANTPPALPAVEVEIPLSAPEDVTGLEARVICRTWPRADVMDAEPNYFPLVEFSEADLPWRYTPWGAQGDQLPPWLALLVLAEGEFELRPSDTSRPLPVVVPVRNRPVPFPKHDQRWPWAHASLPPASPAEQNLSAEERIRRNRTQAVSRIISPRRLEARTTYTAFLVPAFERGRLAGLQQPSQTADATATSWTVDDDGNYVHPAEGRPEGLPVYFQWRFGTADGDFATLARNLRARALDPEVTQRAMDVSPSVPDMPAEVTKGNRVMVEAALKPLTSPEFEPWRTLSSDAFYPWFQGITAQQMARPTLAPPLYGRWYAARDALVQDPTNIRTWFDELNADPRFRVAAGMGTFIVQDLQQSLMASAWSQVEGIRRINATMSFQQLAREASHTIHRRDLATADADVFFRLTAPVLLEVRSGSQTVQHLLEKSPIPTGVLQGTWRRLARGRGPSRRRAGAAASADFLKRLNQQELVAAAPPALSEALNTPISALTPSAAQRPEVAALQAAMVGSTARSTFTEQLLAAATALATDKQTPWMRAAWGQLRDMALAGTPLHDPDLVASIFREAVPPPDFQILPPPDLRPEGLSSQPTPTTPQAPAKDNDLTHSLRQAFIQLACQWSELPPQAAAPVPADLDSLRSVVLAALNPERSFALALAERLHLAPGIERLSPDPLEPILAAPEFPQPMYEPLRDQSQEWILPGLDKVPQDTVALLQTNQRFVEAYMVGLNHEMARELLWHGYPTDQRGSYFRQFWRRRTQDGGGPVAAVRDITPIDQWRQTVLGSHGPATDVLVLLLRSELLRRYPNALIYASRVPIAGEQTNEERHPLFMGSLSPDVTFVGLPFTRNEIVSDHTSWSFVIQEALTEPTFGQSSTTNGPFGYISPPSAGTDSNNSAAVAAHFFRNPVRVLIRATTMLRQMGLVH